MEAMTERVGRITGKASGEHQLPTLPQRASFSPPLARSDGRARQGHRSAAEVLAAALTQRQVAHHAGVPSCEPAANRRCLAASVVPRDSSLCSGQGQTNPALALQFPCSPARGDGDSRAHAARPAPPAAASSRRRFCAIPATHPGARARALARRMSRSLARSPPQGQITRSSPRLGAGARCGTRRCRFR